MKQIIFLSLAIILASFAIFLASHYIMEAGFNSFFEKHLDSLKAVVNVAYEKKKEYLLREAELLSRTKEIDVALRSDDPKVLEQFAKTSAEHCQASFLIITDTKGQVIAKDREWVVSSVGPEKALLSTALKGKSSVDIVDLPESGLSLLATAPLLRDGVLVGVLLIGESFQTHSLVDTVKREIDLEMTIFRNDVRISTTIDYGHKRAIGTHLNNPEIEKAVLREGRTYIHDVPIFDQIYKTVYWPLSNNSGAILGMWFIGARIENFEKTVTNVALSCLAATLVIALALSAIGILFFRTVIVPLEEKAFRDALTGINNRAGFNQAFRRLRQQKKCQEGTLFLIDLDNFKNLNDTLGHPVGDICLRQTGHTLQKLFRDTDIIARLGGDEFVAYAPTMCEPAIAIEKAQQICDQISSNFPVPDQEPIRITASIGIAMASGKNSAKALYHQADLALYKTKRSGRNGYTLAIDEQGFQTKHLS